MKNKKIKYGILFGIIVSSLLSVLGYTYAVFRVQITGNENASRITTTIGALELVYEDGDYISATDFLPPWTDTKTITVENTGDDTVAYSIVWEDLTNTFANKDLLTYTITSMGTGAAL